MYFFCNEYRMRNFVRLCAKLIAGKNPPSKAHYMMCELKRDKYKKDCKFNINNFLYIPYFEGIDPILIDKYNILIARKLTYYYDFKRDRRNFIEIKEKKDEEEEDNVEEELVEEELSRLEDILKDDRPVFDYLKYEQIVEIYEEKLKTYYDLSIDILKELDLLIDNLAIDDTVKIKRSLNVLSKIDMIRIRNRIFDELQNEIDRLNKILLKLDENKSIKREKIFSIKWTVIIAILIIIFILGLFVKKKN